MTVSVIRWMFVINENSRFINNYANFCVPFAQNECVSLRQQEKIVLIISDAKIGWWEIWHTIVVVCEPIPQWANGKRYPLV